MKASELLADLSRRGVQLWSESGRLKYRAPKGRMTPELLAALAELKSEILPVLPTAGAEAAASVHPLSHNQRALWFLYQLAPGSAAYNICFAARLRSPVNLAVLRRTLKALVERHPLLRTTFSGAGELLVQRIHEQLEPHFEQVDAAGWSADELDRRVQEVYRQPFDLEHGPVLRVHLFTVGDEEHVLLLVAHHITMDAWSLWILLDEFRVLYPSMRLGTSPPLTLPKTQYADFVRWQVEMLGSPEGERLRQFWETQLAGEWPSLNLHTDRPRPPVPTYRGASHLFALDGELSSRIRAAVKEQQTTLYTFLLAAYQVLLHRLTGEEQIMVGSAASGRSRAEFADVVGMFVNRIVLRSRVVEQPTFRQFLTHVRQMVLGALEHQDYPFQLLVERLEANGNTTPFVQVTFSLLKSNREEAFLNFFVAGEAASRMQLGDFVFEPYFTAQQEGQANLGLHMGEAAGCLRGVFKYNTDLFDAATVARISEQFEILLRGIVNNIDSPLADLPLLTDAERQQMFAAWDAVDDLGD